MDNGRLMTELESAGCERPFTPPRRRCRSGDDGSPALLEENRKLAEDNVRLRQLDTFKSRFLYRASHELRTPLAIVQDFVGILRDGIAGPLNSDQKDCMDSALRNCERLAHLVDDLLDLQKIESGRLDLRRKRLPLVPILERCARDFRPRFQAKGQRLTLETAGGSLEVLADEARIMQVAVNLLGNAHKFTPAGGAVVLRAFRRGDDAVVEVEDSGPGIAREDQEDVFREFSRVGGDACLARPVPEDSLVLEAGRQLREGGPASGPPQEGKEKP
jgi:signal transduction histidine kinase